WSIRADRSRPANTRRSRPSTAALRRTGRSSLRRSRSSASRSSTTRSPRNTSKRRWVRPARPPRRCRRGSASTRRPAAQHRVPGKLVDEIVHAANNAPEWFNGIGLGNLAGAVARVKPDATAYWNRQSQWDLLLFGVWSDHTQDARNAQVLRDLWKAFDPFTRG